MRNEIVDGDKNRCMTWPSYKLFSIKFFLYKAIKLLKRFKSKDK